MSVQIRSNPVRDIAGLEAMRGWENSVDDLAAGSELRTPSLVIIDPRALDRECLASSIRSQDGEWNVQGYGSIQEWKSKRDRKGSIAAILLSFGGRKFGEASLSEEIRTLASEFPVVPVVVLADSDNLNNVLKAHELGARSYIPTSVGVEICVKAIKLAIAGGTFVPVTSAKSLRQALESGEGVVSPVADIFTLRQAEVADALRRGKANKIIAFELNLRESTVKVHVRNIMKKLKATNRTEVAFKINDLYLERSVAD